ncbi:MAG: hypothetical protein JW829_09955 [Pirellulales bacterium]|nr:hypothetical protein [Pirellulales bacterium]
MEMSFRVLLVILFAALITVPVPSHAGVFERDFVPGSGDGLLTYDDVNQREWLDLTVFAGAWSSDDAFWDAWGNPDFDFLEEFPQLAPGGIYEDFTLATRNDVIALAQSAGIDTSTAVFEVNDTATNRLIDLLGVTYERPPFRCGSLGFIDEMTAYHDPPLVRLFVEIIHIQSSTAGIVFNIRDDLDHAESIGLMLHRQGIPEPSGAILLIAVFLLGVLFTAHSNTKRIAQRKR